MSEDTKPVQAESSTKEKKSTKTTTTVGLLDSIVAETKLLPEDSSYDVAKVGVSTFIKELVKPQYANEKINKSLVDRMIAEIDEKLSLQVDEVLHNDKFQKIESIWRSLYLLVERTDFTQNIKIELFNTSKEDLLDDFEDALDITQSGLYKHIYTAGYGQFGGQPVGAIIGAYDFNPVATDMKLINKIASVSAMSHAPFISSAGHKFFGLDSFGDLPAVKSFEDILDGPQYTEWRGFREKEDAKYVGLTLPRFLLRVPYDVENNPIKRFAYNEKINAKHENYLWGNSAFAMATRITESFAKYRWCPNIIGPQSGGAVTDLPIHTFESMGDIQAKIPTEVLISDRKEYELAEQGFIALTMRKDSNNAAFFSANSSQKAKKYPDTEEGRNAEFNFKLGIQLPYLFVITRLAHYIKVLQREYIGSWAQPSDIERELNKWIGQYIANQDNPSATVRSRKPLRNAKVTVSPIESEPGWYKVGLSVQPHLKYMGASFTLSLVGKLDTQ